MIVIRRGYQVLQKSAVSAFCSRKFADDGAQEAVEVDDKWNGVYHFYLALMCFTVNSSIFSSMWII